MLADGRGLCQPASLAQNELSQDIFWMLALLVSLIGIIVVLPGWTSIKSAFSLSEDFFEKHK